MTPSTTLAKRIERHIAERQSINSCLAIHGKAFIARITRTMSLRAVSRSVGLSATYLSLVMNGKIIISFDAYLRLWRFENETMLM